MECFSSVFPFRGSSTGARAGGWCISIDCWSPRATAQRAFPSVRLAHLQLTAVHRFKRLAHLHAVYVLCSSSMLIYVPCLSMSMLHVYPCCIHVLCVFTVFLSFWFQSFAKCFRSPNCWWNCIMSTALAKTLPLGRVVFEHLGTHGLRLCKCHDSPMSCPVHVGPVGRILTPVSSLHCFRYSNLS